MIKAMIIDSHAHVFGLPIPESLRPIRTKAQGLFDLFVGSRALPWIHQAQVALRLVPEPLRWGGEILGAAAIAPHLLLESTAEDLVASMNRNGVDRTLVLAHSWGAAQVMAANDSVLKLAHDSEGRIGAVVNLGQAELGDKSTEVLREFQSRGARALKIHAASDGWNADHAEYKLRLSACAELGLPVILHTGCIHGALYRNTAMGNVREFDRWFGGYPEISFILAHTGFHDPESALQTAAQYSNVLVETSWQPAEIIAESVRRLGAERVLFGSDWPLVGGNQGIGLERIRDAQASGWLTDTDADLILGGNAARVFKLGASTNAGMEATHAT